METGKYRSLVLSLASFLALLPLTGCAGPATLTPQPTPASTPTPTPVATPRPSPTLAPPTEAITLTIWTTEEFLPSPETPGGKVMEEACRAFQDSHPGIAVEFVPKKAYGKGGTLDFLLTASAVAPQTLPDLVTIDAYELGFLTDKVILQPWDGLISEGVREDLFPVAQDMGLLEGQLLGMPFCLDMEHMVYKADMEAPPTSWEELATSGAKYAFPAGGEEGMVNDSFLIQYLASGGSLFDEEGRPRLESGPLVRVLRFYEEGYEAGLFPINLLEIANPDRSWELFMAGEVEMAEVDSHRFLAEGFGRVAYASLPTEEGERATIARGWAWALVAKDPNRQAAAKDFVEWMMEPDRLGAWCWATYHLPAGRSALRLAIEDREFRTFARQQLEAAHFRPPGPSYRDLALALQGAVESVIEGRASPEEAALQALQALKE